MHKGLKIFLRVIGGILVFVILFIVAIPLLFKDEIIETVRRAVDRQIEGAFYFEKADVGILKTFPNLCLELTSPVLTGGTHPQGDSLFSAELLGVIVDVKSLLRRNSPIKVVGIDMRSPRISIYSGMDGTTNYDLVSEADTIVSSESADTVVVDIEKYTLRDARLKYVDRASDLEIIVEGLEHHGKLKYQSELIDLNTETDKAVVTLKSEGVPYLNRVTIAGRNAVNIDLQNSVYTLADNILSLNALQIEIDGTIAQSDDSTTFDLAFSGERNAFKNLISLFPNMYTREFDAVKASGNFALSGTLQGSLSEGTVPVYRVNLLVDNGAFQYPGKPLGFKDVALEGRLYNAASSWMPAEVDLPSLHFVLNDRPFDAKIKIRNPADNGTYVGTIKGILDLADVYQAYPLPDVSTLQGIADANIAFDIGASRSTADQSVSGSLNLHNLVAHTAGEQINIQSGVVQFTPLEIKASTQAAQWNGSPMTLDLRVTDYVRWLTNDEQMTVAGNVSLEKFDANTYVSSDDVATAFDTTASLDPGIGLIRYDGNITINTLIYDTYVVQNGSATLAGTLRTLEVKEVRGEIHGTRFNGYGTITDVHKYLDGTSPLTGVLYCTLDNVYVDKWIAAYETTSESASAGSTSYVALPGDLLMDITFKAEKLEYDNIKIQSPRGKLHLENRILEIHEFKGNGMGGDIEFSGVYNTQDIDNPAFSMKYDLRSLRFAQVFNQVETFQILAPVAEFVQGIFNSQVVFDGRLGKNYIPDFSTLSASGFLETLSGSLQGTAILDKLSQFLNLKSAIQWDLANTKNWFEIKDGYVELQEVTKVIDDIEVALGGRHKIQGEMDYLVKLNIPADRLSSNPIGNLAKAGYEQLQSKAASYGVKLNTIESFVVHVGINGKLSEPKFQVLFFDASGKSLKDVASDQLKELKEQVRDTVTAIADAKVQEVKDSLREIIDTAVDSVRRAAEEKLKEAGKELVAETATKLDSTIRDSVTNAVIDKLGDKAIENIGQKEKDKIKDALDKFDPFKKKKKD